MFAWDSALFRLSPVPFVRQAEGRCSAMSKIRKLRVQIRAIVVSSASVSDMERSIRFYKDLGFTKVNDFTLDDPSVGDAPGLEAKELRGVFTRLGHGPSAPVLDLVQFIDPLPQGQPYPTLNNIGICRIAFSVDDIDRTYEGICRQRRSNLWRQSRNQSSANRRARVCSSSASAVI